MTSSLLNILSYTREIVIACTFFTIVYTRSIHVIYFTVCAIIATVVAKILKAIIKQQRPVPKLVKENNKLKVTVKKSYGMPSSHSTAISFFAAYLQCVMMYDYTSSTSLATKYVVLTLFHCFAFGVIWSRVRLEHHTEAQVIAGSLLGISLAILSYFLWRGYFAPKLQNLFPFTS